MRRNISLIILFSICFFISGGCDIEFGGNRDNGNGDRTETVEGTIIDVTPSRTSNVSNITVVITDEEVPTRTFSDTTGSSGFFRVEGRFSGNPQIEFLDEDDEQRLLGEFSLNVFPNARVRLGSIRLNNNNVIFEDDTRVTFSADITDINCTGNSGSLKVEARNERSRNVVIQISNSTDIIRDGNEETCSAFRTGQDIRIDGFLLIGNNVEATRIEIR